MEFDQLALTGCLETILCFLDTPDLINVSCVCRMFRWAVNTEVVWRSVARSVFATKRNVCDVSVRILERQSLSTFPLRDLKALCKWYKLNSSQCLEKREVVELISNYEMSALRQNECLAHYALRVAHLDASRDCLMTTELCSIQWRHRLRSDGPLSDLCYQDPWYQGRGVGTTVEFSPNGTFKYCFGQHSPLEFLRQRMEQDPTIETIYTHTDNHVNLITFGVLGSIVRHPHNWGK
jgi:hypothetical protein